MSSKKKAEQRKEFKEYLSIADKRVLDIKKSGIELIAEDEVFVLVNGTNNYWISKHGRLVNNLRGYFHMHKTGYAHYTLSGINTKIETYTDKLVAEHFLERIRHKPLSIVVFIGLSFRNLSIMALEICFFIYQCICCFG